MGRLVPSFCIKTNHLSKDTHGRMRCMGLGITPTMIYGRGGCAANLQSVTNIRAELEEKMELQKQEMETRIQAEREAYKIEMDARIKAERESHKLEMEAFKKEILSQFKLHNQFLADF